MKLAMPYVRDEVERMLKLAPSTASGLISYSKLLGDRYMSRSIYPMIRKIVMNDVLDGVMPTMCWETQTVDTLATKAEMYVYHHIADPSDYTQVGSGRESHERLRNTLMSLQRRCPKGSASYDALDQTLQELWLIRRSY